MVFPDARDLDQALGKAFLAKRQTPQEGEAASVVGPHGRVHSMELEPMEGEVEAQLYGFLHEPLTFVLGIDPVPEGGHLGGASDHVLQRDSADERAALVQLDKERIGAILGPRGALMDDSLGEGGQGQRVFRGA